MKKLFNISELKLRKWEGQSLQPNEFLLKVKPDGSAKLSREHNGNPEEEFLNFGDLDVYILNEKYRKGWQIDGIILDIEEDQHLKYTRILHPLGFTIEILSYWLLQTVMNGTTKKGIIKGKYKYSGQWLIPKKKK